MINGKLDEIDQKILSSLQQDARRELSVISRQVYPPLRFAGIIAVLEPITATRTEFQNIHKRIDRIRKLVPIPIIYQFYL